MVNQDWIIFNHMALPGTGLDYLWWKRNRSRTNESNRNEAVQRRKKVRYLLVEETRNRKMVGGDGMDKLEKWGMRLWWKVLLSPFLIVW